MTDQPNDKSAPKSPVETVVEHAVETLVYAPIGLLFEGASLLPQLVEKGRSQVTMARMLGKFAVDQGRAEATKVAGKLQDQAAGVLELIGGSATPTPNGADTEPSESRHAGRPPARRAPKAPGAARAAARQVAGATHGASTQASTSNGSSASAPTRGGDAAPTTELAIPDYDGLSASHVVNRLAGLSPSELEDVRRYEAANRGRKTILSKVAQLQAS